MSIYALGGTQKITQIIRQYCGAGEVTDPLFQQNHYFFSDTAKVLLALVAVPEKINCIIYK